MRIALLCPHIFMHKDILPHVIFSPGNLAISLVQELIKMGNEVTFFSPGYDIDGAKNIHPDMSFFEKELEGRGYGYVELLKKHPLTFISIARQVQTELISMAYEMGNQGKFDIIHSYMNEEDLALTFANHSKTPVVFTHHDPYNFYPRYRAVFPKYKHLPMISISYGQRKNMPEGTNWVGNVYHGVESIKYKVERTKQGGKPPWTPGALERRSMPSFNEGEEYFAYFGRIVEAKGVHLAIEACKKAGVSLKIAGKHYSGGDKEDYWEKKILPFLDSSEKNQKLKAKNQIKIKDQKLKGDSKFRIQNSKIEYVGFLKTEEKKREFLSNAKALIVPSIFDEPFGMVMIEAMALGVPVIGLDSGAVSEVVEDGVTGFVVPKNQIKTKENAQCTIHNATVGKKQETRNEKQTRNKIQNSKSFKPVAYSQFQAEQITQNLRQKNNASELDETKTTQALATKIKEINKINRSRCREEFEKRFTAERMGEEYLEVYREVLD